MADVQEKIQEETLEGSETSENNSLKINNLFTVVMFSLFWNYKFISY